AFMWHWKSGLFHQVCHLEHEYQQQASDGRSHRVEKHYRADRMKDQRQSEGENEERQLAKHERGQIRPTRPRKRTLTDGAGDDVAKIAVQVPTDRGDAVQQPQVDVLPAMP